MGTPGKAFKFRLGVTVPPAAKKKRRKLKKKPAKRRRVARGRYFPAEVSVEHSLFEPWAIAKRRKARKRKVLKKRKKR
jgi:hypothetical protein